MIGLVQTGGTIASVGRPLAPLPAGEFRALWERLMPPVPGGLMWKATERPIDSTEATPADWAAIANQVLDAVEDGATGVVCLHGTDTLAHAAAALAMLTTEIDTDGTATARLGVPLVVTGAMRPLFDGEALAEGSDAQANVRLAIGRATYGGTGTVVAFAGDCLPGARVAKVHTTDDAAFAMPNGHAPVPPLPQADPASLRRQIEALAPHAGRQAVLTVTLQPSLARHHAGALSGAVDALGEDLGAIHLLGYGSGNVPAESELTPILRKAANRGVLIVLGSQVPAGPVASGTYAAGAWLAEAGAIGTGDMTVAAANTKQHLALALASLHGWDRQTTARFFEGSLAGERSA